MENTYIIPPPPPHLLKICIPSTALLHKNKCSTYQNCQGCLFFGVDVHLLMMYLHRRVSSYSAKDGGINKVQEFCNKQNSQVKNIQGGIFLTEHRIINCTFSQTLRKCIIL